MSVGSQPPGAGASPESIRNCAPRCGGTRISRSYGSSSPSRLITFFASRSMDSTLKKVCSSMPFSARMGVAISLTLSMVNARPMGEQKWISLFSRSPRSRSSDSIRNETSSGAGGHL